MAGTIVSASRQSDVVVLDYPAGFTHAACGCLGCRGLQGDCIQAVASRKDIVTARLADGRDCAVRLAVGATPADALAAIQGHFNDPSIIAGVVDFRS